MSPRAALEEADMGLTENPSEDSQGGTPRRRTRRVAWIAAVTLLAVVGVVLARFATNGGSEGPEPPSGPLTVIPGPDVEDPLVSCGGIPAVPYSRLIDPPSIDDVEHPAVDVLRAVLDTPSFEPLPRGRWVVISIDDNLAIFATLSPEGTGTVGIERRDDTWILTSMALSERPCEPAVQLPPGLARVVVRLDPDSLLEPTDTSIRLLVTESGCANGRHMGDALKGPQIIETDDTVLVAFAVVPIAGDGDVTCPGNPFTSVTIGLSEPLGQRTLYDGLYYPPKPLTSEPNEHR